MSREKAIFEACGALFDELDARRAGAVGVEELARWLRVQGRHFPLQEVAGFLQQHSKRGALSHAELLAVQTAAEENHRAQQRQQREVFDALSGGAERLSAKTLMDYFRQLGVEAGKAEALGGLTELDFEQFCAIFFSF